MNENRKKRQNRIAVSSIQRANAPKMASCRASVAAVPDRLAVAFDSSICLAACSASCRDSWAVVDRLAAGCSASCRASVAAVPDRLAAAFDSSICLAACSASCRDSWAVVDWLAVDCSGSCRVAVAGDSADRLAAMAWDISGFSDFSGYFSVIFVKRLLSSRRGCFSFFTAVDGAASFRFSVTGNSIKTFFCSMDIEEWR